MKRTAPPTTTIIVERLEYLIKMVEAHIIEDRHNFDKIDEFMDGNGRPGIKMRVDRLAANVVEGATLSKL